MLLMQLLQKVTTRSAEFYFLQPAKMAKKILI